MNERIEKLAKKAGFGVYGEIYSPNDQDSPITKNIEKFAKLIIRECADIFEGVYTDQQRPERIDTRIKEHFGVEK